MHNNIVWTGDDEPQPGRRHQLQKETIMKKLIVVLVAVLPIVGCGQNGTAVAPTPLAAPDGNYKVSGIVMAQTDEGELPLAGVEVVATSKQDSRSARTGSAGTFVLDRMAAGEWTISAAKHGFLTDARRVSVSESDASMSFELLVDNTLSPERPVPPHGQ